MEMDSLAPIMHDEKQPVVQVTQIDAREKSSNNHDREDMLRMGKSQELVRTFRFISIVGFATIVQATWESALLTSSYGLFNGGTAGIIWLLIIVWLFMMALIASLSELASAMPTAGGQYHWVSEIAPKNVQGLLSYIIGWYCCLGWISGIPTGALQLASLVQQMVLLSYPDANIQELWQATLMGFAFLFLCFAFNFLCARYLAFAESVVLAVHVCGFAIFLIVLWTLGPHVDASTVFTNFNNGGGWPTQGVSTLVGLTSPLWILAGADASSHMSEELRDASLQLPRAMMWAIFGNGILAISMLITFCFCIEDLQGLLDNGGTMPVVQILYQNTQSIPGTIILCCLLCGLLIFSVISTIATTSRQVWAFSRDKGLPFSDWILKVSPALNVPQNALFIVLGISVILLAINFGSNVALNAILSVSNAALIFSYVISVGCIRLRRLRGLPLPAGRWSLGRWGWLVNDVTMVFLLVSFVFCFFPEAPSVGDDTWAADFNWAIIIFVFTMMLSLGLWFLGGARHTYVPPVVLVKPFENTE